MKTKILLFLTLGLLMGANVQAQQIEWKTIEQAAKTDTKGNTKLYFVDFYTSWCGWCKKMDRETFTDPTVALILNKYYIPVKFNAEGNSEFTWHGSKYNNVAAAPGNRPSSHSFAKRFWVPRWGSPRLDCSRLTSLSSPSYRATNPPTTLWSCFGILLRAIISGTPLKNISRYLIRRYAPR